MFSTASGVQYNPKQCPICANNLEEKRCYGFVTSSYPRPILGIFKTITDDACPKFTAIKTHTNDEYKKLAEEIRQEGGTLDSLNRKGVAEKSDPIKSTLYYFVGLEKAIEQDNVIEKNQCTRNLEYTARTNKVDLRTMKAAIGFVHDIAITKQIEIVANTLDEAEKVLKDLPNSESIEIVKKNPPSTEILEGKGDSETAAIMNARKVYSPNKHIGSNEVCEQYKENSSKIIKANSEEEFKALVKKQVPAEASNIKVDCMEKPEDGFLGMGKKPGTWKVAWEKNIYNCKITYQIPAKIIAEVKEII